MSSEWRGEGKEKGGEKKKIFGKGRRRKQEKENCTNARERWNRSPITRYLSSGISYKRGGDREKKLEEGKKEGRKERTRLRVFHSVRWFIRVMTNQRWQERTGRSKEKERKKNMEKSMEKWRHSVLLVLGRSISESKKEEDGGK